MGFRKTEKGNVIYDFDFTPKKLVPIEEGGIYAVEGEKGERAPVKIIYQNPRHLDHGIVFARADSDYDMVVVTNVCVIAAFCKMGLTWEQEEKGHENDETWEPTIDYFDTGTLAREGMTFTIPDIEIARHILKENGIPRLGYEVLRDKTS